MNQQLIGNRLWVMGCLLPITYNLLPFATLNFAHLNEVQLHGGGAAKYTHQNAHLAFFRNNLVNHAVEVRKGAINDSDFVAPVE